MPVVWLIRHGESQSNVGESTGSPQETQLTEVGRRQAQEIVKVFGTCAFLREPSHIITSKYTRSQQTAYPTIKTFSRAQQEEWPVHEFTYLAEAKTAWTTRQQRYQAVQQFWMNNDPNYSDGAGAESFKQFITRAYHVLECLRENKGTFIVVFTHGQFIQAVLWLLHTKPKYIDFTSKPAFRHFWRGQTIPAGSIQELVFHGREEVQYGKLMTDHLHLETLQRNMSDNSCGWQF